MRRLLTGMFLALAVVLPAAAAEPSTAKAGNGSAKQEVVEAARTVGHATRDVARSVGHAARDTTKVVGHAARDVVREARPAVHEGAKATGKAVRKGAAATGHAVAEGARSAKRLSAQATAGTGKRRTAPRRSDGAGDGNRTHVSSLGSYSSTIELHPRPDAILEGNRPARQRERGAHAPASWLSRCARSGAGSCSRDASVSR